jgi:hypothetical protein
MTNNSSRDKFLLYILLRIDRQLSSSYYEDKISVSTPSIRKTEVIIISCRKYAKILGILSEIPNQQINIGY